ncbi:MAG: 50S ribosomal protein L16 [Candidatus Diapherotrites archaeon]|jgi:large subunit ribosomal protein L10e|nr:50S ribosomal protein L16 [Candidatus Diapherotrites archaeon]
MGLRPGRCYNNKKDKTRYGAKSHMKVHKKKRAYTRVAIRVPRKNYIGAAPALRIRQFNMGNPKGKYNLVGDLRVKEYFDLRDNAIESSRMAINRKLVKELGKDGFFMKVRVYPSNLNRENKQAQGAGADRVSQGMSMSFGVPNSRSARLRKNQIVFSVLCNKGEEEIVKDALMRAKSRFSVDVFVKFHDDVKAIGTIPTKKIREVKIETTPTEAEKKEGEEAKEGEKAAEGKDAEKTDEKAGEAKAEDSKDDKKEGKK